MRAASAVRTLARTETFMPMKPQAPESTAPMTKPTAVGQPSEDADDDEQHDADDGDGRVLALEVGDRALLDRRGDLLHARVAGGQAQDARDLPDAVDDGEKRADEREDETCCTCCLLP